jgi:N-dimethylarginine dimethylaminohydrolase
MNFRRSVLMGDPSEFRILGGANPHTRTRWGFRKTVDRALAMRQWRSLADRLRELGVAIYVVPAIEQSPGLVYPANAGFLTRLYDETPLSDKRFYLSQPIPTRIAEHLVYEKFLRALGFHVEEFAKRFEGEADFFPAGGLHLFTSGFIIRQRFVPRLGWPPYRRLYGFRSSPGAIDLLRHSVTHDVLPLTLVRETHYHGDTCLCAFGKDREFLMAYLPALSASSQARLKEAFGDRLLPLSEPDGELFSANSFQVDGPEPVLVMPETATEALRAQVRERGVRPVAADVSEFMEKGGGSVKCLIGDLGPVETGDHLPVGVREFRSENAYEALFGVKT